MAAHAALRIIREEHDALSSVLRSIRLLLDHHKQHGTRPDFSVLRAMLFYVDEFPERLHHTKESELLFPLLRARSREAAADLERLDQEHKRGERSIRDLQHALLAWEMMGDSRREAFEEAVWHYVDFYLRHMRLEDDVILPLAQRVLDEDDWQRLDAAFEANRDPLAGHEPDGAYRPVFLRILMEAPEPIGLGKTD